MKVLTDYRTPGTDETTWVLYDGNIYKSYASDELAIAFCDLLKRMKEAEHIYITNLSLYTLDFIQVLWRAGFSPVDGNPSVKKMKENEFKYLINGDYNTYSITIKHNKRAIVLVNFDNILNLNNRQKIIDTWTWDYDGEIEKRYALAVYRCIKELNRDCNIEKQFPTTISGYARRKWKELEGFWELNNMLPDANSVRVNKEENLEQYCRKSYHGGLNITREQADKSDIINLEGIVLDVNSLYPYIMKNYPMPKGLPHVCEGKPSDKEIRDYKNGYIYIFLRIKVNFRLKKNGIPCVQLPNDDRERFTHARGWLETTQYYDYHNQRYIPENDENKHLLTLTLTITDYLLMLKNYDILDIEYINYIWFATTKSLFSDYVNEYYNKKKNATTEGKKRISKMLLNGLSGNMARIPEYTNIRIHISENGNVDVDEFHTSGGASYIYVGSAITSYAREYIIKYGEMCGTRWIYSDTDSLHILGTNIPNFIKIGDDLGEWKIEKEFDKAIYYKRKMYGFMKENKIKLTLAGVPQSSVELIESIIQDTNEVNYSEKDCINPTSYIFDTIQNSDDDYIEPKNLKVEKYNTFLSDAKKYGLKCLMYSEYPVTYKKHGIIEFSEELYCDFATIHDRDFLKKKM